MKSSADNKTSISESLSRHFATMSFVSALLIVYLHTGSSVNNEVLASFLHKLLSNLCRIAIPWFFFASGFFLAGHIGEVGWWLKEVRKRVRTLAVPFWIWSSIICLFWILMAVMIRATGYSYSGIDAFQWLSLRGVFIVTGIDLQANIPTMWFLKALFILVVLSPLIYRGGGIFVVCCFIVYFLFKVEYAVIDVGHRYFLESVIPLRGLVYFSCGMYMRSHMFELKRFAVYILLCVGLGLLFWACSASNEISRLIDVFMVPFLMISVFAFCRNVYIPSGITSLSFPIYLVHGMIAYLISAIYGVLGVGGGKTVFILGLVRCVSTTLLAIGITMILRKTLPAFSRIAFGGR